MSRRSKRASFLLRPAGRIWSRYDFPEPFGVELVGAVSSSVLPSLPRFTQGSLLTLSSHHSVFQVLRQASFIERMEVLGWLAPHRFDIGDFRTIGR